MAYPLGKRSKIDLEIASVMTLKAKLLVLFCHGKDFMRFSGNGKDESAGESSRSH